MTLDSLISRSLNGKHMPNRRWSCSARVMAICWLIISLTACGENTSVTPQKNVARADTSHYVSYDKNGLLVNHPPHWIHLYDEPGIEAKRELAFETQESSRITLYMFQSPTKNTSDIANSFAKQLKLDTSSDVKEYSRQAFEIEGYKGVKLTWVSTQVFEVNVEVTILKVHDAPVPTFVQFYLFDSDIQSQSTHIVPFIKGININKQKVLK